MKNWMIFVLMTLLTTLTVACGSEAEPELLTAVVRGTIGGCQIEDNAENLRVGLMGQTVDKDLIELSSVAIDTAMAAPVTWQVLLEEEPPEKVAWAMEGDGVTQRAELLALAYLDLNGDGEYDYEDDGNVIGGTDTGKVYFFDGDVPEVGAVFGYNLSAGDGGYNQAFNSTSLYIAASGGCETGE